MTAWVETVEERSNDDIPVSFEPCLNELSGTLLLQAGDIERVALHQDHVVREPRGDEHSLDFHDGAVEGVLEGLLQYLVAPWGWVDIAGFDPVMPWPARVPCSHHLRDNSLTAPEGSAEFVNRLRRRKIGDFFDSEKCIRVTNVLLSVGISLEVAKTEDGSVWHGEGRLLVIVRSTKGDEKDLRPGDHILKLLQPAPDDDTLRPGAPAVTMLEPLSQNGVCLPPAPSPAEEYLRDRALKEVGLGAGLRLPDDFGRFHPRTPPKGGCPGIIGGAIGRVGGAPSIWGGGAIGPPIPPCCIARWRSRRLIAACAAAWRAIMALFPSIPGPASWVGPGSM